MRARLGQERAPDVARDDLARQPREGVGLHGHLGPKSLPGRSRWCEHCWGVMGRGWRAEERAAKGFERTLFDAPTRPS